MSKHPSEPWFRAAVGAVITRGDRVLVFERVDKPGAWQLPQGGLEGGETVEQAVYREILEETGIRREALTLLCRHPEVLAYHVPPQRPGRKWLGQCHYWHYFHLPDDAAIDVGVSEEFRAWRWVPMGEICRDVVPFRRPVYERLRRYLPAALSRLPDATPLGPVTLREVADRAAVRALLRLKAAPGQEIYVADNGASVAEALFHPASWLRGIYAGETAVGLILLADDPAAGAKEDPPLTLSDGVTPRPEYFLWRLLIGARYQRRGYGREAVRLLVEYVRGRPHATELMVSYVPGEGGPQGFYEGLGFEPTGAVEHGEVIMRLRLDQ